MQKMSDLLFSIIIPVYNNKEYLPMAVNSVVEQSVFSWEIIIVDDGSDDGTAELADAIAAKEERIKVIHQKNQWIYASMNNGVMEASGQYVYILNSDDQLNNNALEILKDKLDKYNHPDVIWTRVEKNVVGENNNIVSTAFFDNDLGELYCSNQNMVRHNWGRLYDSGLMINQANLYKRELIQLNPFRNDVYAADTLFNISIYPHIKCWLSISEPIYKFFEYPFGKGNASEKDYGYENVMFNEIFRKTKDMLAACKMLNENSLIKVAKVRINNFFNIEISRLLNSNLSNEKKIKKIFFNCISSEIIEAVSTLKSKECFDRSILRIAKELLDETEIGENSDIYFVKEIIDGVSYNQVSVEIISKVENAVNHELNPFHIGEEYLDRLKIRYSRFNVIAEKNVGKVLWISNMLTTEIIDMNLFNISNRKDDIERAWRRLKSNQAYKYAICVPIKKRDNCCDSWIDDYLYYSVYLDSDIKKIERRIEEVINIFAPDEIYIWDDSSVIFEAAVYACKKSNSKYIVVGNN